MESRTWLSRRLDRILPVSIFFILCFLFFLLRIGNLIYALLLAIVTAGLLWYGLLLFDRAHVGRRKKDLQMKRIKAEQRLIRMEEEEALGLAFEGLKMLYPMDLCGRGEGYILAAYEGKTLMAKIHQAADELNIRDVQAFDRKRGDLYGILISCSPVSKQAVKYASALHPPIEIMRAASLDIKLDEQEEEERKKQGLGYRFRALWKRAMSPQRDIGYMQAALFLFILFIISNRLLYLVPGLVCAFLGALCRGNQRDARKLFQADL